MSDDNTTDGSDPTPVNGGNTAAGDVVTPGRPDWIPAVLRGAATIACAGIVLAVALAITAPNDADSSGPQGSATALASATTTTAAAPPASDAAPTTTAKPVETAPPEPPAPPTAPPPDAPGPVDERCPEYVVREEFSLEICDKGALVAEVQTALTAAGFTVEVDGFFTSATEDAVIEFQTREGLDQDGRVGSQTGGALGIG